LRALVTGCAGYIGSLLTQELLAAGHEVTGVDSLRYGNLGAMAAFWGSPRFRFFKHDARDDLTFELARRADVVVPLAALVGAPVCDRNPEDAVSVNEGAIAALVRSLSPQQRIIYPNTCSGYGKTDGERERTEEDAMEPISLYGRVKCEGERAVLSHPRGVSLRLATVFGVSPRMRFDLLANDFTMRLTMAEQGRSPCLEIFEPHFVRNFVHVRDVCGAFLHMVDRADLVGPFNVCRPDANVSKMQLAELVSSALLLGPHLFKAGDGADPDGRNCAVSSEKIRGSGLQFRHSLAQGIVEVGLYVRGLELKQMARMRNA
jgi:nucleoside-diphosphate-sugar epimerase